MRTRYLIQIPASSYSDIASVAQVDSMYMSLNVLAFSVPSAEWNNLVSMISIEPGHGNWEREESDSPTAFPSTDSNIHLQEYSFAAPFDKTSSTSNPPSAKSTVKQHELNIELLDVLGTSTSSPTTSPQSESGKIPTSIQTSNFINSPIYHASTMTPSKLPTTSVASNSPSTRTTHQQLKATIEPLESDEDSTLSPSTSPEG